MSMGGLRLYGKYIRINFLSGLQYKGWPFMALSVLFTVVTEPITVFLLFSRFGSVGSWTVERVMLVYGLAVASFGLAEVFSRGFDYFPWQIRTGEFDRILLRPRNTFLQIIAARFHVHRISRAAGGLTMVVWALVRMGVAFTPETALMLLLSLAGGYLTYTGVFVLTSAVSFWTLEALDWIYIFTNISYQVVKSPPEYLPKWLFNMFIYVMPMMLFCYFPASAICGWGVPQALGWLALPAGAAFLGLACLLWKVGVRHYASTGS